MAQLNLTVGDLSGNTAKIIDSIQQAKNVKANLIAFTELAIPGYPPEDLLLKPQFIEDNIRYLDDVVRESVGITSVVGFANRKEGRTYNAAAIAHSGQLVHVYHKMFLPNYGVFDEKRYFDPGDESPVYIIDGVKVGVNICEDIWYEDGPVYHQAMAGAEIIVNINGSPFHAGKGQERIEMLIRRAVDNGVNISYTNTVGGQDELVFDGGSLVVDREGKILIEGKQFSEEIMVVDLEVNLDAEIFYPTARGKVDIEKQVSLKTAEGASESRAPVVAISNHKTVRKLPPLAPQTVTRLDPIEQVRKALVLGTRDYVSKSGFEKVVLGLSGGIDSAITVAIAVEALGTDNVIGVSMPSRYSSEGSVIDSSLLSKNLSIEMLTIPIEQAFAAYEKMLKKALLEGPPVTEENLQARIRGNILMALSNAYGWLVLTTGNKSEIATGYSTLYGDMVGGFGVIKDVPKTLVYDLAVHVNRISGYSLIPEAIIAKAPSAELRPNQRDDDTLPSYEALDPILKAYVEDDKTYDEILQLGYDSSVVKEVIRLVDRSEYKRRQASPGIKITHRNFGRDRRMPIVNRYKHY
ncbi:MAG: NAD+ synthase (glutamine-hydrolysing) [Chloroflexi bacterium]|jgi:NAD+ synthase (glutamine-hydrolysing)|nr:MAG: NAD+ synthase (glutamine-hydrolysing) [Chloroflexota bacterium]